MGWGLVIIGLFLMIRFLLFRAKVKSSLTWLCTEGKITKSKINIVTGDQDETTITIQYEYEINNKKMSSNRLDVNYSKSNDSELVDKYPVGKIVDVYYDPNNIRKSILERGDFRSESDLLFWSSVILVFFGLGIVLYFEFYF